MRNAISLLLAMMLCITVFAGCKKNEDGKGDTSGGGDANNTTTEVAAVEAAVEHILENYRKTDDTILETVFTKVSEAITESEDTNIAGLAESVASLKDVAISAEDKIMFESLGFIVNDVTIEGDSAIANVTIQNADFAALYTELGASILSDMGSITELDSLPMMEKDGIMEFTLTDGEWVLSKVDIEFADVITFGIITWMTESMSNAE